MLGHVSATREAHGGVLVVGGGFAGAYVARELGDHGATIVSKENFMLYTPLLPEAASGTLEPRHCVVPLREMCPHAELILGSVTGFDLEARTASVETDEGAQTVAWHELVVALGAVPRTLPVPGLPEHALSFKSLADAIHLRNHVLHQLETADAAVGQEERSRRLTFVFVGAGYAGVEALGTALRIALHRRLTWPGTEPHYGRLVTTQMQPCPRQTRNQVLARMIGNAMIFHDNQLYLRQQLERGLLYDLVFGALYIELQKVNLRSSLNQVGKTDRGNTDQPDVLRKILRG